MHDLKLDFEKHPALSSVIKADVLIRSLAMKIKNKKRPINTDTTLAYFFTIY